MCPVGYGMNQGQGQGQVLLIVSMLYCLTTCTLQNILCCFANRFNCRAVFSSKITATDSREEDSDYDWTWAA